MGLMDDHEVESHSASGGLTFSIQIARVTMAIITYNLLEHIIMKHYDMLQEHCLMSFVGPN